MAYNKIYIIRNRIKLRIRIYFNSFIIIKLFVTLFQKVTLRILCFQSEKVICSRIFTGWNVGYRSLEIQGVKKRVSVYPMGSTGTLFVLAGNHFKANEL